MNKKDWAITTVVHHKKCMIDALVHLATYHFKCMLTSDIMLVTCALILTYWES